MTQFNQYVPAQTLFQIYFNITLLTMPLFLPLTQILHACYISKFYDAFWCGTVMHLKFFFVRTKFAVPEIIMGSCGTIRACGPRKERKNKLKTLIIWTDILAEFWTWVQSKWNMIKTFDHTEPSALRPTYTAYPYSMRRAHVIVGGIRTAILRNSGICGVYPSSCSMRALSLG